LATNVPDHAGVLASRASVGSCLLIAAWGHNRTGCWHANIVVTIVTHPAPRTPRGERCDATGRTTTCILPSAAAAAITENAGQAAADPASAEPRLKG
jgi:hypothetical protein